MSGPVESRGPPWRFAPLDHPQFPVGTGPFHARGLAYNHAFHYVDQRVAGGRAAFLERFGKEDPLRSFYDQIFLVAGEYDISPLLRLFLIGAELGGVDVGSFIRKRALASGATDTKGIWKPALHGATAREVAPRLSFAFDRYYPPCAAEAGPAEAGRFEGELRRIPSCMNGLYAESTVGFYLGALGAVGARDIRVRFEQPAADGSLARVPLERLRFAVTWEE